MFNWRRFVQDATATVFHADIPLDQVKPTGKGKEAQYQILTDDELKRLISEMQ